MINSQTKEYSYYLLPEKNSLGQQVLAQDAAPDGVIKMSITETGKGISDNKLYLNATYIGLTFAPINENYIIQYGEERLKVLYTTPSTRYTQVFLARM